jgi:hypothetical protein
MPPPQQRLRKFRFSRPQQIAAALLVALLAQCLWVIAHHTLNEEDYRYARCGREMWEKPSPLAGYFTTCGNIHDGTLAYRAAGLPLTLERVLAGADADASSWELRHELSAVRFLLLAPFTVAALALGSSLWWVARRLFGNQGGYFALALYCFSPAVVRAGTYPNNEILAAFGLFALVYTAIGVSHAMQGPVRKWRPRIVLLAVIFGFTAAAHISAFLVGLALTIVFMSYLAEGKRSYIPTLVLLWTFAAMVILFASYAFRPDAFSYVFRSAVAEFWISLDPARFFFRSPLNLGITTASAGALALWFVVPRSRYFGNSAPLAVALLLLVLVTPGVESEPWLWALPFLLLFAAGVFADVFETRYRRLYLWLAGALAVAQGLLSVASLPLLAR